MWNERLLKLSQDTPYICINPLASEQDIIEAETRLGIGFPNEFKECLLEANGSGEALFSINALVEINLLTSELDPNNQFFRVATNGWGDDFGYKLINKKTLSTNIYLWDDELNKLILVAANLKEAMTKHNNNEI